MEHVLSVCSWHYGHSKVAATHAHIMPEQNFTYPFSGNSRVVGHQYSITPLSSADITTSNILLYFITLIGPMCICMAKTRHKAQSNEKQAVLSFYIQVSQFNKSLATCFLIIGSLESERAS